MVTLVPSYGRDYTSKKAVLEAWNSGKDFTINNIMHEYDGKQTSIKDIEALGSVNIRYDKLRKVIVL